MQREIKFRAWVTDYDPDHNNHYMMINFNVFNNLKESLHDDEHSKIMQYTGLNDKNGVEIYEGDIVIKDSYTEIAVVEYYSLCCNYTLNDTLLSLTAGMATNYFEGKVIGNIYENPELLEVK